MQDRTSVLILLAASMWVGGCTTGNSGWQGWGGGLNVASLPNLEMDFSPAVRRPVARRPAAPAPHRWTAKGSRKWTYIVVHHSATGGGNAEIFHRQHLDRGWDELGYHFVICNGRDGGDGEVQVGSRWRKQKWGAHTGGTPGNEYNEHGIGICLVGDFTNSMPTAAQMKSFHELVGYLRQTQAIGPENVIAHREAPNAHTECCGRTFFAHLRRTLRPALRTGYAAAK